MAAYLNTSAPLYWPATLNLDLFRKFTTSSLGAQASRLLQERAGSSRSQEPYTGAGFVKWTSRVATPSISMRKSGWVSLVQRHVEIVG
jgi:hypothetical protein